MTPIVFLHGMMCDAPLFGPQIAASSAKRTVRVPTLVLCGEDDIPCPLDCHELIIDLIPRSVSEVIRWAGHLPTLQQPDATTYALTRWLEEDNG